jgi:hypothetical protein
MDKNAPYLGRGINKNNIKRLEPAKGKRDKINEPVQRLENGRPEPYSKVHMLRGVMRDVHRPEKTDLVIESMKSVI